MGALTQALAKAVTDAGGEIRTDSEVTGINVSNDRVSSVVLANGAELPAWTVVSGADPGADLPGSFSLWRA